MGLKFSDFFQTVKLGKKYFLKELQSLREISKEERLQNRYDKLMSYGAFKS